MNMGAWGTGIDENDTYADVYAEYFQSYNSGTTPDIASKKVKKACSEFFNDPDDCHHAWFALAFAQWETKSLEKSVFEEIKRIVDESADHEIWKSQGASAKELAARAKALKAFLAEISSERKTKKRRVKPRKTKLALGNVVEIALADQTYAYGVIVPPRLIAFSSANYSEKQEASVQLFSDIAFTIAVMDYAIGKKHWPVVGNVELTSELKRELVFFNFDMIAKKFNHLDSSWWTIGEATFEQCVGLEPAAAWDPEHVESRLLDTKNGVPNVWVESLKAEKYLSK